MAGPSDLIAGTKPLPEPHVLVSITGEILGANPAAWREFGIQPQPLDARLSDVIADAPPKVASFLGAAARSTSSVPGAFTVRTPNGVEKRYGCVAGLVQPKGPEQPAIVLMRFRPHEEMIPGFLLLNERIHDLTRALHLRREAQAALEARSAELVRLTEDLERQKEEAQAASRAKSHFLAAMSHELKTPLNGIMGYVDLLNLGLEGSLTPGQRRQLVRIHRGADHLSKIVNQILDFSSLEAKDVPLQVARVDLAQVVKDSAEMIEPAFIEARLRLTLALPSRPVMVRTDEVKVRQVLLNLLSNAAKFTETGGAEITLSEDSGSVFVAIEDTGIGVDPEHLELIFEPFWQRRRDEGGTGLGLTVTRQLVRRLGGALHVEGTPGRGSTFTLSLPVTHAAKRVLLVEDDLDTQAVYSAILVHHGYEVLTAENGQEAVRLAREERPDLVLLDIDLPILNGWEAAKILKDDRGTEEIPIVAISGGTTAECYERATSLGFEAYHAKPFSPTEVLTEVRRLLESSTELT